MKTYGGVDVYSHIFLTSALVGGEWSASRPCRFTAGENASGTHYTGGWLGLITGLDVEKRKFLTLTGLKLRPLCRPASSQSLYQLHYPGSCWLHIIIIIVTILGDIINWGLDWMIGFIGHLYIPLGTTSNTALSLMYTLYSYSSPIHTHTLGLSVFTSRIPATNL
jgi:hypothetical protein